MHLQKPAGGKVARYEEYLYWRVKSPRAAILLASGAAHYNAVGFDAVLLMEHAGARAMCSMHCSPFTQIQRDKLNEVLEKMEAAGLTVVS